MNSTAGWHHSGAYCIVYAQRQRARVAPQSLHAFSGSSSSSGHKGARRPASDVHNMIGRRRTRAAAAAAHTKKATFTRAQDCSLWQLWRHTLLAFAAAAAAFAFAFAEPAAATAAAAEPRKLMSGFPVVVVSSSSSLEIIMCPNANHRGDLTIMMTCVSHRGTEPIPSFIVTSRYCN